MSESLLRKGNTHCVLVSWPNAFGAVKNKEKENSGLEKVGTETRWIFTGKEFDSVLFCRYTFKGFMQYICTQVESVAFSYAFILTDRSTSRRSSFHSVWYLQNIVAACYYPFWVWVNFSTGDWIFESESTALSVSVFCLQHTLCVQDGWNILFTFPVCASHSHSQWNGQSHFSLWHLCVCVFAVMRTWGHTLRGARGISWVLRLRPFLLSFTSFHLLELDWLVWRSWAACDWPACRWWPFCLRCFLSFFHTCSHSWSTLLGPGGSIRDRKSWYHSLVCEEWLVSEGGRCMRSSRWLVGMMWRVRRRSVWMKPCSTAWQ